MHISVKNKDNFYEHMADDIINMELKEFPLNKTLSSVLTTVIRVHGKQLVSSYNSNDCGYVIKDFWIGEDDVVEYNSKYESGTIKLVTSGDLRAFANKVNTIIALEKV